MTTWWYSCMQTHKDYHDRTKRKGFLTLKPDSRHHKLFEKQAPSIQHSLLHTLNPSSSQPDSSLLHKKNPPNSDQKLKERERGVVY